MHHSLDNNWEALAYTANYLGAEPGTHAYSAWTCPLCRLEWVPGKSRGSKQAYRVTHQPVHVVSQCSLMLGWCLASGDQRWLTGSGGTLETWLRRCSIQMAAFTLIYFTGNRKFSLPHLHSTLPLARLPSEYFITICCGKTRMAWLHDVETILKIRLFVSTEYTNVTDRHHTGWHHTGCLS